MEHAELIRNLDKIKLSVSDILERNSVDFEHFLTVLIYQCGYEHRLQDILDIWHDRDGSEEHNDIGKKPYHKFIKQVKRVQAEPGYFEDIDKYGVYSFRVVTAFCKDTLEVKKLAESNIGEQIKAIEELHHNDADILETMQQYPEGYPFIIQGQYSKYTRTEKFGELAKIFGDYTSNLVTIFGELLAAKLCTYITCNDMDRLSAELISEFSIKEFSEPKCYENVYGLLRSVSYDRLLYIINEDLRDKEKWPYTGNIIDFTADALSKREFLSKTKVSKIKMMSLSDDGIFSNGMLFKLELLKRLIILASKRKETWAFKNRLQYSSIKTGFETGLAQDYCGYMEHNFMHLVSDKIIVRIILGKECGLKFSVEDYMHGAEIKDKIVSEFRKKANGTRKWRRINLIASLGLTKEFFDEIFIDE